MRPAPDVGFRSVAARGLASVFFVLGTYVRCSDVIVRPISLRVSSCRLKTHAVSACTGVVRLDNLHGSVFTGRS
ncbi:uncharacterized protein B0I36DRAFT_317867 [Microdochium trichocladiopsis]|uniref:Uncharacterized protein n=1 Tax=Microdochium trichocladiopsis TaxID=1682393 RepID=A0A9P8YB95_9PEZI|nr:uncharacterized protein B0I36DRAFT_317867 [Microdochium trichocladiopsis]KAH7035211.1 hypothetical protein B0I36DRAFT_317867 [Microdochium trichocladiopsis]